MSNAIASYSPEDLEHKVSTVSRVGGFVKRNILPVAAAGVLSAYLVASAAISYVNPKSNIENEITIRDNGQVSEVGTVTFETDKEWYKRGLQELGILNDTEFSRIRIQLTQPRQETGSDGNEYMVSGYELWEEGSDKTGQPNTGVMVGTRIPSGRVDPGDDLITISMPTRPQPDQTQLVTQRIPLNAERIVELSRPYQNVYKQHMEE